MPHEKFHSVGGKKLLFPSLMDDQEDFSKGDIQGSPHNTGKKIKRLRGISDHQKNIVYS